MIRAIPINETDGNDLYREFFDPAFVSQRLGTPGHWQGVAAQTLRLTDPVRLDDFRSLLQGCASDGEALIRREPYEAGRTAAWRITLAEDGPASVALWALLPAGYRTPLRQVHTQAVHAAIADFEHGLNGRPWFDNREGPGRKSVLFAEFQGGATRQQAPRLHTNLFLFNLRFQKGGETRSFAAEEVSREAPRMGAVYTRTFAQGLSRILGHQVQIPPELCLRLEAHPLRDSGHPQGLESRRLFAAWQQQAQTWGWGPERVGKLIGEARSRPTLANWNLDGQKALRFWALWLRAPEHSPLRVLSAMMEGHERKRSQSREQAARHQSHDQGMSH